MTSKLEKERAQAEKEKKNRCVRKTFFNDRQRSQRFQLVCLSG